MTTHFDEFIATIAKLRGPDGCPWDRQQDHKSLARYLLEEAYEVLDAIHEGDQEKIKEELGDLLLQIVLNARVAEDNGQFNIQDIAEGINKKMIKRHPHVFGEAKVETAGQVVAQWEELKEKEARENNAELSIVDNVPKVLPALIKALKVSEKAVSVGFEWESQADVWEKVLSELQELKEELNKPPESRNRKNIELELGDVLFTLVNLARWQKLDPEESLLLAIEKFRARFRVMERLSGKSLRERSASELNELWEKAKRQVSF